MNDILDLFKKEFLSDISLDVFENNNEICFGNLDYDFSLLLLDGRYILRVYLTALDHYGMPYRNPLSFETYDVTNLILNL
jgi:hypothetical protein